MARALSVGAVLLKSERSSCVPVTVTYQDVLTVAFLPIWSHLEQWFLHWLSLKTYNSFLIVNPSLFLSPKYEKNHVYSITYWNYWTELCVLRHFPTVGLWATSWETLVEQLSTFYPAGNSWCCIFWQPLLLRLYTDTTHNITESWKACCISPSQFQKGNLTYKWVKNK